MKKTAMTVGEIFSGKAAFAKKDALRLYWLAERRAREAEGWTRMLDSADIADLDRPAAQYEAVRDKIALKLGLERREAK